MSSLGPEGNFLNERPAGHVRGSTFSPIETTTDVSAAPLWMTFRDYYTRARERRRLGGASDWVPAEEQSSCPCP